MLNLNLFMRRKFVCSRFCLHSFKYKCQLNREQSKMIAQSSLTAEREGVILEKVNINLTPNSHPQFT